MHVACGSEVELECVISHPSEDCEWYKNGKLVEKGKSGRDGNRRFLQFTCVSHDDKGEYECRCGDESTKAKLEVKGLCGNYIYKHCTWVSQLVMIII